MNKFRLFVVAAILAAIFIAPAAFAQTPVNISIISGNGQLDCPDCDISIGLPYFDPLQVTVTDANGVLVPNATVNWTVTAGQGYFPNGATTQSTTTDGNGNTNITYLLQSLLTGSTVNPFAANTINASIASGASVNFYLTQTFPSTIQSNTNVTAFVAVANYTPESSPSCPTCPNPGDTLTGTAGSTSSLQFQVSVYAAPGSTPAVVPNVSLRLINNQSSPSISCATGAGADPGSVLTNANGVATCTGVFGPTRGSGSFNWLVGGVVMSQISGGPLGFATSGNYYLQVTPGLAGMVSIDSGNNQGANPGTALPSPLVATVGDTAGNPLSGQGIVWSVSPAGAATLTSTTSTSNSSGQVQTNVTLTNSAAGTIQIKAALSSNPNIFTTFTVTANIQISGLQIISGNSQAAVLNAAFAPLVLQLSTSNGESLANIPVFFNITGPAFLSTSSTTTNSSGQAQVNVTAGSATGAVTVTASAGGFSQTFNLTVIPSGPTITANNFYNGADFQLGAISPCSIATIIAPGIAPAIQGAVAYDGIGALPYVLAGDSVTFNGAQAPIYNVANMNGQQQVTFQVPCSVTPGSSVPVTVGVSGGSATVSVPVLPASPGLFTTQISTNTTIPVLERPDGSFVSPTNPARRGETLIAYVTGLGPTSPAVATNSLPVPGSTATVLGTVIVGVNGAGVGALSAILSPDIVGAYEIQFQVPSSAQSGANASFSIGLIPEGSSSVDYSTLGSFPVQ